MKRAIVYYSLSGNTKKAASILAELIDADLFEIRTEKSMPKSTASLMLLGDIQAGLGLLVSHNEKLVDLILEP